MPHQQNAQSAGLGGGILKHKKKLQERNLTKKFTGGKPKVT